MKRFTLYASFLLALTFLFLSCSSQAKIENDPSLKTGVLPNGMTYSIFPNQYPKDSVSLRLVVRAGSLMETEQERGIAHFLEHMLFNGTKSFPESSLVAFLQSQGMQFGGDLNAYTTFDKTVYQLDIQKPTEEDNESLQTALKIMREWLREATLEADRIEKERGIVLKEKLLREGYDARYTDKILEFLYPNTLYLERLPIGLEEVIKTAPREVFVDFYDRWYRPNRASLVIAGDNLDVKLLEDLIRSSFSDLENAPVALQKEAEEKQESISLNLKNLREAYEENSFLTFSDEEVSTANLLIAQKEMGYHSEYLSPLSFQSQLKGSVNWLFNRRFSEILANASPLPYQYAFKDQDIMSGFLIKEPISINLYGLGLFEGQEREGILSFFTEWERLLRHGFTQGELELLKSTILTESRTAYENRDKRTSRELTASLVALATGESLIFPSPEQRLAEVEAFVNRLSLEQVNDSLKGELGELAFSYLYSYSPQVNEPLTQRDILEARAQASHSSLEPYEFVSISGLTGRTFDLTGITEETYDPDLDLHSWVLENGIQIFFKPTSFSPRKVRLSSTALGLVGLSSPEQWRRVAFADGLVNDSGWGGLTTAETKQFLADKNLNLQTSFDLVGRYLGGSFDEEASLDFFEALYALLAEPKIDVSTLEEYLQKIPEQISAQEREYTTPFSQAIRRVFYGNNPYNWDLKDLSLKDITREESLAFYQAQFSGLQEFPFVFVGDLKIDVLKDLTARFLGTIPLTPSQASRRDFTPYAEGDKREVVSNDPEQRVTVLMAFTDNRVPNPFRDLEESRLFLRALELAYERILIEQVREAISGVYGISFRLLPQRQQDKSVFKNRAQVSFVTSPVQLDQVREAVIRTLRAGQERGFSEETVDYVYKNLQKNYRESYRENGYWVAYILQELLYQGTLEHKPVEFYLDALSSARLQALSRQLISLDAMKEVILLPKGQT